MIPQNIIQRRIEEFPGRCRKSGLKVTPQRVAVYNMLAGTDSHPTPEKIYSVIRHQLPSISLGTVYKILDFLNEKGLLRKVSTSKQAARYDACTDIHHHALCLDCGKVLDIDDDILPHNLYPIPAPEGFTAHQIEVLVSGTCLDCRNGG